MKPYDSMRVFFGDIHSHCGISYGHGTLEDALKNAEQQLDFCSVTGHGHWPDMPDATPQTQHIIDFHERGFSRLKKNWPRVLEVLRRENREGELVLFPSFEVHFSHGGDRTVLYRDLDGEILYPDTLEDLHRMMHGLGDQGIQVISFPHHIAYRKGFRGTDWDAFDPDLEPFVEIVSMHGCSEADEGPRPFLHAMGPADAESTVRFGLASGHIFGFIGSTDHHKAHPGSYGHGALGVWARELDRQALWEAFLSRRTFAITGDRIALQVSVNGEPMGSTLSVADHREIAVQVEAGGAIDSVDVIKNNRLLCRFSEDVLFGQPSSHDEPEDEGEEPVAGRVSREDGDEIRTKVFLELGWGEAWEPCPWDVELSITDGRILGVEPRFRGQEVVAPESGDSAGPRSGGAPSYHMSRWERLSERTVAFQTASSRNPNTRTPATQGMCLDVRMPLMAGVQAAINGRKVDIPLLRLLAGAFSGYIGGMVSPAWRFHRAPREHELKWQVGMEDWDPEPSFYYVRVRQKNDQWAWSSPIFLV